MVLCIRIFFVVPRQNPFEKTVTMRPTICCVQEKSLIATTLLMLGWLCSSALGQPLSDGSIFLKEFDGTGDFDASRPDWDQVGFTHFGAGADMTLNGDSTMTARMPGDGQTVSFAGSRALDFSSTPNEWVASTRFRSIGAVVALHRENQGTHPFQQRESSLLRGAPHGPAGNPPPWRLEPTDGFDLRLNVDRETPNSTESSITYATTITFTSGGTFELGWLGHNADSQTRRSQDIGAGGDIFMEDTWYTVTAHRKPDNTVDIWVDDTLLGAKALLNNRNPAAIFIGLDNENQPLGLIYDFISVGAAIEGFTSYFPRVAILFRLIISGVVSFGLT